MNFRNFFYKTQNRLRDSILSLWATGDASMQKYFSHILENEGLMAEPVFQTAFPWEPAKELFRETNHIFNDSFIDALDMVKHIDYRFPKDRHPYKHQIESWDALINQKLSIAVTTGTGSGKTECFMLPVLFDIYENCRNHNGVNAIFLYPLNALIGSQKKRIDAWCSALGGINYAIYNGNTEETVQTNDARKKLPELISRKQIRETPPQILFTNPSMLEYILVRNKDVDLLNNSAGTLRWILLDEAHTLTGSAAAEMALLIRRVVDAFKVDVRNVRFAITSATVGGGERTAAQLKTFMSNLCNIKEENIKVIDGRRVLPQKLNNPSLVVHDYSEFIKSETPELFEEVHEIRKDVLTKPALPLSVIGNKFNVKLREEQLQLVDFLSKTEVEGKSILPLRGHFFARAIGGMYVCSNPDCNEHKHFKPTSALGTMTTIGGRICKCGSTLLELSACRSCGNQLFEGEKLINKKNGKEFIQLPTAITQDPFEIENLDDNDTEEENSLSPSGTNFYFTRNFSNSKYVQGISKFSLLKDGEISRDSHSFIEYNNGVGCPHCGAEITYPLHFRLSSSFINRILADIFLEETPEADVLTKEMLWKGHKYISFTDSRQGAAKISAFINQDNEATWIRSQIYHKLCEKSNEWNTLNPKISKGELKQMIAHLEMELSTTTIPILKANKQKEIDAYKSQLNDTHAIAKQVSLDWPTLKSYLNTLSDFQRLFKGNNLHDFNPNGKSHYLTAILFDQFARRLPRERSLENLGMVSLIYPKLQKVNLNAKAENSGISLDEWRFLLKIAADYVIRYQFHFFVNPEIYTYTTAFIRSQAIYHSSGREVNVKRWPKFERHKKQQNRLALLICAGLGLHEREDIDGETEIRINELLEALWLDLKTQILSLDGDGFKLNLEEATQFQLSKTLWLCPVKKRLIDAQFKGYSPWIKGNLTTDNIRHYKIEKTLEFPEFPFPFNINEEKSLDLERTRIWIEENSSQLKEEGVWNDFHEQVILHRPLYLSGEHSAQQHEKRLKELEDKFEKSEINILNCSTTMEMGIDIGGISTVVMNNVPPSPANYLQRAGRAGRRSESKSLSFTICSPNPVGLNAFDNPMWALNHQIAPPFLAFKSEQVVERHINAFFLGKFVQTDNIKGLNVRINTDRFFFSGQQAIAAMFSNWILSDDAANFDVALNQIITNTPLADKSFSYILNKTISNFQNLVDKSFQKKKGLEEKLQSLAIEFGEDSPAYKAVLFQKNQFLEKNAIGYLAEDGFLPTAGLPTGIIEFDTLNIEDIIKKVKNKSKPSYFITRALTEFAPGNHIVIDGMSYTSEGIILKNDRGVQSEKEIIQSCSNCGFQRIIEVSSNENIDSKCPHCQSNAFKGIKFKNPEVRGKYTEMIQPAGFAIDLYEKPNRKISQVHSAQYVDPLLININPWQNDNSSMFEIRESEGEGEILYYNIGTGNGYAVCLHCGRTATDKAQLDGHRRLRGGKNNDNEKNTICSGNNTPFAIHEQVILGGRFKTDFCEIRFKDENNNYSKNETLLYSLGAVLSKELSHFLAIDEGEINFGIKHYDQFSTVFIFDTAKGGAGYSSQFTIYAGEILRIAKDKLLGCSCEKSCTKCLIDRNTQWHIDKLDRSQALAWLKKTLDVTIPENIANAYQRIKPVLGGIKDEIGRLSYTSKIRAIWLFGSSTISEWNLEKITFIQKLINKVDIHFVLNKNNSPFDTQDKISLIQTTAWSKIWNLTKTSNPILKTICVIETSEGDIVEYLTENYEEIFNANWGTTISGNIYKQSGYKFEDLRNIEIKIDEKSDFSITLKENNEIPSNEIADLLIAQLDKQIDLKSLMQYQTFDVEYSDRYLKTPFGCILMVQFINQLRKLFHFEIESFTFKGQEFYEEKQPYYIYHNFKTSEKRNDVVLQFAEQLGIPNTSVINGHLPHYRFFEFKNQQIKIIIRPDAGIEHGWFFSNYNNDTDKIYTESTNVEGVFRIIKKTNSGILYTLNIEKKK